MKLVFIDLYSFISNLQFFDGALRNRKNVITPLKNLVNGFFLRTWHSVIIWFGLFNQYCQKYQRCHLPSIKIFDTVDYSLNWNLSNTFLLIYNNFISTWFYTYELLSWSWLYHILAMIYKWLKCRNTAHRQTIINHNIWN